jgi:hypothetical protein
MSGSHWEFKWKDKEVIDVSMTQLGEILSEFTLVSEGKAKKKLSKGHGVLTGTLRRSIHAASADYQFGKDNVEPSDGSPERGNQKVTAKKEGNKFFTSLGSGLVYAMRIHQGWGSFAGYHYITEGVEEAKGELDAIVGRHQVK